MTECSVQAVPGLCPEVKIVNRWFMVQTLVLEDNLETEDKLEAKDNLEGVPIII